MYNIKKNQSVYRYCRCSDACRYIKPRGRTFYKFMGIMLCIVGGRGMIIMRAFEKHSISVIAADTGGTVIEGSKLWEH
jgi:hypothetical protein